MPKSTFDPKSTDYPTELFEKIIKIVRKHDGNYTAMQDDSKTTQLIMKEIEKWQEGVSRLTPLCKSIILGDDNAGEETFYDTKRFRR
jgi:hypothetical protein